MFKRGSISCRAAVSPSFNGKMSSAFNGHYLNQRFHVLCKYLGLRGHVCKALFLPESLRHQCYGDLFSSHIVLHRLKNICKLRKQEGWGPLALQECNHHLWLLYYEGNNCDSFSFCVSISRLPDEQGPHAQTVKRPRRHCGGEMRTAIPSAMPAASITNYTM